MKSRPLLPYAGLLVLALAAGIVAGYLALGRRPLAPPTTTALLLHHPKPLPDFSLVDGDGKLFTRASLVGHWSFLYFGYTHCPDACPTTLAALAQSLHGLGNDEHPQVVFVSVDPKRDDPKLLKGYAAYFDPSFLGATGSLEQLQEFTAALGVAYAYGPKDKSGNYSVDHSVAVFLIDPAGRETAVFSPPFEPKRTAADYRAIVAYYGDQS